MSTGFDITIRAVPFFDLVDKEEETLAEQLLEVGNESSVATAMDTCRRRLAQGVDTFIRSLPTAIRNDANTSRAAAYALVALADERMLHHPAGGLNQWRERLLEFELYGSALAGQEIVTRARASAYGTMGGDDSSQGGLALLAPLYLGILRAGFEGSLRGDIQGLSSLTASLEETIGSERDQPTEFTRGVRPKRIGLAPLPLAIIGLVTWLISGFGLWLTLPQNVLQEAAHIAERISAGLPVTPGTLDPLERSVGPSDLPPSDPLVEISPGSSGRSALGGKPESSQTDLSLEITSSPARSGEPASSR